MNRDERLRDKRKASERTELNSDGTFLLSVWALSGMGYAMRLSSFLIIIR